MKAFVFILVLANMLFYAFSEGYFGRPENPDAGRLERQVSAERMKIVSRGEAPALPVKAPEPVAPPPMEDVKAEQVVAAEAVVPVCLAWTHLAPADAARIGKLLESRFAAFKPVQRELVGESNGWWVFIPPLPDKDGADRKAAELREFGVTDYFIVQEVPNRFAISLGVFSTEKGAQERLAALKSSGVRSARLIPRPAKGGTVNLQASGPADVRASLQEALVKSALPKGEPCP